MRVLLLFSNNATPPAAPSVDRRRWTGMVAAASLVFALVWGWG